MTSVSTRWVLASLHPWAAQYLVLFKFAMVSVTWLCSLRIDFHGSPGSWAPRLSTISPQPLPVAVVVASSCIALRCQLDAAATVAVVVRAARQASDRRPQVDSSGLLELLAGGGGATVPLAVHWDRDLSLNSLNKSSPYALLMDRVSSPPMFGASAPPMLCWVVAK